MPTNKTSDLLSDRILINIGLAPYRTIQIGYRIGFHAERSEEYLLTAMLLNENFP